MQGKRGIKKLTCSERRDIHGRKLRRLFVDINRGRCDGNGSKLTKHTPTCIHASSRFYHTIQCMHVFPATLASETRIYTARHLCKTHGNFVLCGMDAATF